MSFSSPRTKLQTSAPLSLNSKIEEKLDHPAEGVGDHLGDAGHQAGEEEREVAAMKNLWSQALEETVEMPSMTMCRLHC